jgi:hypothetical protein
LQRGDFYPHLINGLRELIDGPAAFAWCAARSQLGCGSGTRDAGCADTDRRSFQGVCERSDRGRFTSTHSLHQEFRLPVEELQDFPLKAAVV